MLTLERKLSGQDLRPFGTVRIATTDTLGAMVKEIKDNGRLRLCEDMVLQPDGEQGSYTYLELPWPVVAIVPSVIVTAPS